MKLTNAILRTPEARLMPHNPGFLNRSLVWANCRDRSGLTESELVSLSHPKSRKDQNTTKAKNSGIIA
mgnify:CR=1 FL=1